MYRSSADFLALVSGDWRVLLARLVSLVCSAHSTQFAAERFEKRWDFRSWRETLGWRHGFLHIRDYSDEFALFAGISIP